MAEAMPCAGQPLSWSDIPWDLAGMVLRRLPAYVDRVRFAAVCPQWRAASKQPDLPPALPLLALPKGTFYSLPYKKRFRFHGLRSRCIDYKSTACGSWLFFPRRTHCLLVDHFAGLTMRLPVLPCIRNIVKDSENPKKLVLCSPNLVAAFISNKILVCQPGASSWSIQTHGKKFQDMTLYQGKLYVVDCDEALLAVDISQDPSTGNPQVSQMRQVIKGKPGFPLTKKLYLVESHGSLLMVRRNVSSNLIYDGMLVLGTSEFMVFVADLEHSHWVNVTTLGDGQWLFLGQRCSKALSMSQYGKPGDLIFFLGDVMENGRTPYDKECTSVNVYNMRTGKVDCPLPIILKHDMIPVTWLFPWN